MTESKPGHITTKPEQNRPTQKPISKKGRVRNPQSKKSYCQQLEQKIDQLEKLAKENEKVLRPLAIERKQQSFSQSLPPEDIRSFVESDYPIGGGSSLTGDTPVDYTIMHFDPNQLYYYSSYGSQWQAETVFESQVMPNEDEEYPLTGQQVSYLQTGNWSNTHQ